MLTCVEISNGQKNQLENNTWKSNFVFNPRTVVMIGETKDTHIVSIEERETGIPDFQFLKSRPIIDYNPKEEYQ